jgi:transcriptional regulator with XRE-family HTH domain
MKTKAQPATTLAAHFAKLRAAAGLSMRALAKHSGVDATIAHKIETGSAQGRGRVRAESLAACLRGLGLGEDDPDYIQAFALWTNDHHARTHSTAEMPEGKLGGKIDTAITETDSERARMIKACDEALDAIPREHWDDVLRALKKHRALRLWIESTDELTKRGK